MSTTVADSPQATLLLAAEIFQPDCLIANDRELVSDTVTITGGIKLKRGSVLGCMTDGRYRLTVSTAIDGSNIPVAILANHTDASAGDVKAGVYLGGDFHGDALALDPTISLLTAQAALRPRLIFVKGVVA